MSEPAVAHGIHSNDPAMQFGEEYCFDKIPRLRDLLPRYRGLPGYEYAQITMQNAKRAQSEGWYEVDGTAIYTIVGPKGRVDCKLFARGKRIIGQSHNSGRRVLKCDKEIQRITGLEEESDGEVDEQKADAGQQAGSVIREAQPQDREGGNGQPGAHAASGRGKGGGDHPSRKA